MTWARKRPERNKGSAQCTAAGLTTTTRGLVCARRQDMRAHAKSHTTDHCVPCVPHTRRTMQQSPPPPTPCACATPSVNRTAPPAEVCVHSMPCTPGGSTTRQGPTDNAASHACGRSKHGHGSETQHSCLRCGVGPKRSACVPSHPAMPRSDASLWRRAYGCVATPRPPQHARPGTCSTATPSTDTHTHTRTQLSGAIDRG
jgi:hypothetical protein